MEIKSFIEEIENKDLKKKLFVLWASLEKSFREMPASVKFHHSHRGGLYQHTKEVIEFSIQLYTQFSKYFNNAGVSKDDAIFISLIHDLDKIDKYRRNDRKKSQKDTEFIWNYGRVDRNDVADIVSTLGRHQIQLTQQQLNALTFSHGGWSVDRGKMGPLATLVHCADILSLSFEKKQVQPEVTFTLKA